MREREAELQQSGAHARTLQQQLQLQRRGDSQRGGPPPAEAGAASGVSGAAGPAGPAGPAGAAATGGVMAAAGAAERVVDMGTAKLGSLWGAMRSGIVICDVCVRVCVVC